MTNFLCLKQKEVICVKDGNRLGFICDLEIDIKCGEIKKIIVPEKNKCFGIFGKEREYRIPWCNIKTIGEDLIIIDCNCEDFLCDI